MRRLRAASLAALTAMLLLACASPARPGGERLALVIGNAAYENAAPLKNPTNDAADMCAALKARGFRTLCHTNLRDRADFDARVRDYVAQLRPDSVGVVYYSGHGVQAGTANYLIPTAVQTREVSEDPTRVLYGVDEMFAVLEQKRPRFQLVILDACRADLFAAPPAGARGVKAPPPSNLIRSLATTARAANGLQPIQHAPAGTMVLYATASRDTAYDGDGRNGPLTRHILAHIGTPGIFVEEFFKRVTSGVERETERDYARRQTPFIYGSFSGRFCFAGCPGDTDVPLPPAL